MQDRSKEGFGWLLVALPLGFITAASQNPWIKLFGGLGTAVAVAKAGECFQDTAKHAYYQLVQASESRHLQRGY